MSPGRIEYEKDAAATFSLSGASNVVRVERARIPVLQPGASIIGTGTHWISQRLLSLAAFALLFLVPLTARAQDGAKTAPPESNSAAPAPAYPRVGQVLDRYEEAIGGPEAWAKFTSRVTMGTIEVPSLNLSGTVMIHEKAPNKMLAAVIINGAAFQQGYDGIQGWTDDPKNGLRDQTGPELAESKRAADFLHAFHLRRAYATMVVAGTETVNDRDTWVIEATVPEGGDPTRFYFDKKTGFLLRVVSPNHDADGVSLLREDLDDYREVDGVKVPFVSKQTNGDTTYTMTISEVHHNVELNDSEFAKPSTQPAAQ